MPQQPGSLSAQVGPLRGRSEILHLGPGAPAGEHQGTFPKGKGEGGLGQGALRVSAGCFPPAWAFSASTPGAAVCDKARGSSELLCELCLLPQVLAQQGEYSQAIPILKAALKLEPSNKVGVCPVAN